MRLASELRKYMSAVRDMSEEEQLLTCKIEEAANEGLTYAIVEFVDFHGCEWGEHICERMGYDVVEITPRMIAVKW